MKNIKNASSVRKNQIKNTNKNQIFNQIHKKNIIKDIINNKDNSIYLISQRNNKIKENDNLIGKNQIDLSKKELAQKILIKAFSSNKIEKMKNTKINSSKLLVNKKYKNNNNELNINRNFNNINMNNKINNNSIKSILESASFRNKIFKRNPFNNMKKYITFNNNKYNSKTNLSKSKYMSNNTIGDNSNINKSNINLNNIYFKNNNKGINNNKINYFITINRNINNDNKINNNNNTISNCNYIINDFNYNYFNKQNYKNNNYLRENNINELSKEIKKNENPSLSQNNYTYKKNLNIKNCKSLGAFKEIKSNINDIINNNSNNTYYYRNTNSSNNNKNKNKIKPSILIEDNSNSLKNIIFNNKSYFKNYQNKSEFNANISAIDKINKNKILFTFSNNNKEIKTIYSKKKLQNNNINKNANVKQLTTNKSSNIFTPTIKVKNKGYFIYSNNYSYLNANKSNSLPKNIDNKLNNVNINISNYSNSNNNHNISNYNSTNNMNSYNNTININNENPIKKKLKKYFIQNNKTSNYSNSINHINFSNDFSLNNLNSIEYDYLSKLTKKNHQNNFNNVSNAQKKIYNYVSKEKKINKNEIKRQKEYYNNQTKIYNRKNNFKNNRIKNRKLLDSELNNESMTKIMKIKKINENNKSTIDNSININNYKKKKYKNLTNNNNNIKFINDILSNNDNLSQIIDLKKIDNNFPKNNFKKATNNENSLTINNQKSLSQMIKDLKMKIKNKYKDQLLQINPTEDSPNRNAENIYNNNKHFSKPISKENNKKNDINKVSEGNLSKIIHLKKPLNKNELNINKKINKINKEILNQNHSEKSNNILMTYNININNDPQYIYEYAIDIIESLLLEENYFFHEIKYINPFYLENEKSQLTPEMRTIAVDWLVLIHYKLFKFQENTLFLAIQIFDRYLSKVYINCEKAELLLITSLILASKHNEIDYVNMQEALELCRNKFNKEQIIKMEYEILKIINFEILAPTSVEFFTAFANFLKINKNKINEGLFILNIILADYHMLEYPNFMLALAVLKLITKKLDINIMKIIKKILKENDMKNFYNIINLNNNEKLIELCDKIKILYDTFLETKYKNIQEKFSLDKYGSVSSYSYNLI